MKFKLIPFIIFCFLTISLSAEVTGKKVISFDDYSKWSKLRGAVISDDGDWFSIEKNGNGGEDTLIVKGIDSEVEYVEARGENLKFDSSSNYAAYVVAADKKDKKSKAKGVLLDLKSGTKKEWDNVSSFTFAKDGSSVVVRIAPEKGSKAFQIVVVDLVDKDLFTISEVKDFEYDASGAKLAYIIDSKTSTSNGVYLYQPSSGVVDQIESGDQIYSSLVWDHNRTDKSDWSLKGEKLAYLSYSEVDSLTLRDNTLSIYSLLEKSVKSYHNLMENMVISEYGNIFFSRDNSRVFFGIKEQSKKEEFEKDSTANLDLWHWNDEYIQSVQMKRYGRLSTTTWRSTVDLKSGKFTRLSDESLRSVDISKSGDYGIGSDPRGLISDLDWGGSHSDYYLVDINSGERTLIAKGLGRAMGLSPFETDFLYFKDRDFYAYNIESGKTTNITDGVAVEFFDTEEDHPYDNPSYGVAGWVNDGKHVVLNHRYDLWSVALDGSGAENITGGFGTENSIVFRVIDKDAEGYRREPAKIDLKEPTYLTAYGDLTKQYGYYKLNGSKEPKELIFGDYLYSNLSFAKESERIIYTKENLTIFPDYIASTVDFKKEIKLTDANPQQSEFAWSSGKVLIDFENSKGDKLQGTLTLPANYEKGKKYPMMVYFYEKLTQRHFQHQYPVYDDRFHASTYASDGYLVFMPDIKYEEGIPGFCAVDCVTSATKKVIELGYADSEHIGIQGHSWGGYQSSFIITQTDMFAACVTGAPVTNLTSMYNILYKNSGTVNHGIFEKGQVRMGHKDMLSDLDNYIAQSPVFQADKITTPFMILHGTVDGAVDWSQGLEYFSICRRLGKEVMLLSYPNENHHLAIEANQIDFITRMKQFFDHYLKGADAQNWMVDGIDQVDKKYRKIKKGE